MLQQIADYIGDIESLIVILSGIWLGIKALSGAIRSKRTKETLDQIQELLIQLIGSGEIIRKLSGKDSAAYAQWADNMKAFVDRFGILKPRLEGMILEIREIVRHLIDKEISDNARVALAAGSKHQVSIVQEKLMYEAKNRRDLSSSSLSTRPKSAKRIASSVIALLVILAIVFASTGCAGLFERTLRPNNALDARQKFQPIAPILKAARANSATPATMNDIVAQTREETLEQPFLNDAGQPYLDGTGKVITTKRTTKEFGIPAPALDTRFSAGSEFVTSNTTGSLINTAEGGSIDFGQKADVAEGAYADGVQGQVLRTQSQNELIGKGLDMIATLGANWIQKEDNEAARQYDLDLRKLQFDQELQIKRFEAETAHVPPAGAVAAAADPDTTTDAE